MNPQQIPVNCPFAAKVNHPQSRDGLMRTDYNGEGEPTIYPNSRNGTPTNPNASVLSNFLFSQTACMINSVGPMGDAKYNWKPVPVTGVIDRASSSRHAGTDSEYDQVRNLRTAVLVCFLAIGNSLVLHNINNQGT